MPGATSHVANAPDTVVAAFKPAAAPNVRQTPPEHCDAENGPLVRQSEATPNPRQPPSRRCATEQVHVERDDDIVTTTSTTTSRASVGEQPQRHGWLPRIFNRQPAVLESHRRHRGRSDSADNEEPNRASCRKHRRKHRCTTCPEYIIGHVTCTHSRPQRRDDTSARRGRSNERPGVYGGGSPPSSERNRRDTSSPSRRRERTAYTFKPKKLGSRTRFSVLTFSRRRWDE
jgi:hypothetical protein